MSFFHDAAFTKSSIQLQVADTDAMAFLDAEFYEETPGNDLDDDVQKFLEGTVEKETAWHYVRDHKKAKKK